ncbi:MAG TPA: glycoside hydrolase family 32 protein [Chryseolinea sp.]
MIRIVLLLFALILAGGCVKQNPQQNENNNERPYSEAYRPQVHFSPPANWMNDPNGMVFHNGVYHLFYQYYPDSTVWGPMHWGHATTSDLVFWENHPIALYPDSLGYIFSGSAVVDEHNTAGFGKTGEKPLVAIFTHHNPKAEKESPTTVENQSIAFSLDEGKTWTKYAGNPVVKNPGIRDFRDPKVFWYEADKKWIMTLAASDQIIFYSSPDLKNWNRESEFGKGLGAHGGVWECPDLFPLDHNGQTIWVLIVNINPGGPNDGSATQYFIGQFDGKKFTPYDTDTRWADYGPDNYAGVTWSNTGSRKIFMGWMSNWKYANVVPTGKWRSASTLPRDLSLKKIGDRYFLCSLPAPEIKKIAGEPVVIDGVAGDDLDLSKKIGNRVGPAQLMMASDSIQTFAITLSNEKGDQIVIGFDDGKKSYYVDRTRSGNVTFSEGFGARHTAPRLSPEAKMTLELIIDDSSVEVFADGGLSVMTSIFFVEEPFTNIKITSSRLKISSLTYSPLSSIWK